MARNTNKKKDAFLTSRPTSGLETSNAASRCSFNFSYFSPDKGGQCWEEWSNSKGANSLESLMNKLTCYTESPLSYWESQRVGAGGLKVLEFYASFPKHSKFKQPPSVPHDVRWGRFRMTSKVRLAGFVVPTSLDGKKNSEGILFNSNIFYVVFLDKDHEFWPTGEAD
ncbi:hypothetical protein [Shewanella sp. HN-41]|uniref:hypothetical protein n=1 Tax=Shewanella sp. HN-41 TaxID=327275 RepID=UPI0011125D63|nr:hypothetical protein [Shewanella sp. HN-41]